MAGEADFLEHGLMQAEQNDLLKGTIDLGTGPLCASVGPFEIQQVLKDGGFSPMLLSTVTLRGCLLPQAVTLHSGLPATVTHRNAVHKCKIYTFKDLGSAWEIVVNDLNQNA